MINGQEFTVGFQYCMKSLGCSSDFTWYPLLTLFQHVLGATEWVHFLLQSKYKAGWNPENEEFWVLAPAVPPNDDMTWGKMATPLCFRVSPSCALTEFHLIDGF